MSMIVFNHEVNGVQTLFCLREVTHSNRPKQIVGACSSVLKIGSKIKICDICDPMKHAVLIVTESHPQNTASIVVSEGAYQFDSNWAVDFNAVIPRSINGINRIASSLLNLSRLADCYALVTGAPKIPENQKVDYYAERPP